MTVVILVIIKRPAFTQSYISTQVKILCTDFHDCKVVRMPCLHQKGTGSIPVQGTTFPQPAQRTPPKKNYLLEMILFVICTEIGPTPLPFLWEYIAPKSFLANRWPNHYLVCSLQTLFQSLGVLFVGFRCISILCLLSTFSRQHR